MVPNSAAGSSAYKTMKRRIEPTNKKLCGRAFDHQSFGSQADSNDETIDVELKNATLLLPAMQRQKCFRKVHLMAVYVTVSMFTRSPNKKK